MPSFFHNLGRRGPGSCTKKADFRSEAGPRTTSLHTSAVHAGIQLLFVYQNTMEEGKKLILVGPCTFSALDWLENFRMSQATFLCLQ